MKKKQLLPRIKLRGLLTIETVSESIIFEDEGDGDWYMKKDHETTTYRAYNRKDFMQTLEEEARRLDYADDITE